jgi:glycerate kinase
MPPSTGTTCCLARVAWPASSARKRERRPSRSSFWRRPWTTTPRVFVATTGIDVGAAEGAGASGGLGAAVLGLLSGKLYPRYDIVMNYLDLDSLIARANLVITAEGSLDGQTPFGKVPAEVGHRAKAAGLPVIALAGTIGKGVTLNFEHGIDAFASILKRPCSLDEAIGAASKLLVRAAEDASRMILVGMRLNQASTVPRNQNLAPRAKGRAAA